MFRNSKNSSVHSSSETNGSLLGVPPIPPRGSSASVAMSELSASGLIEFSDHSADRRYSNNRAETNDCLKKRVSRVSEEGGGESNNDDEDTEKSANNKKQDSTMGKMWKELQFCLDNDENDQLNPFSKRRMLFVFLITVLAIVVNLIIIPIALTNMDHRRINKQQALNQTTPPATDPPSIQPSISTSPTEVPSQAPSQEPTLSSKPSSLPSQMPSLSPTKEGETRPPTVKPTEAPTKSPTQLPSNTPTIALTTSPTQRPITAPIPSQAVAIALPPYTIQALDNPNSPQYKAFQWLAADPNLNTYTAFRQYQRMALATFFFATNYDYDSPSQGGGNAMMDPAISANLFANNNNNNNGNIPTTWYSSSAWLSYTTHECFWFSQASFVCDTQQRVRNIQLQDNGLAGTLPPELAMLTLLQSIDVSRNAGLFGSIPTQLGDLMQLSLLNLSQLPQLSGTIPYQLANLHNSLVSLHLYETPYLSKSISTQLGRLTKLQELLLDTRYFGGEGATTRTATLPTELASMRALQQFRITGMELQGTLPSELAQLSQLEELYIGRSNISGAIPDSYGTFLSLTSLELISNQLSSTLPSSLSLLGGSLEKLKVNSNELTGTIPFEYSSLTNCKTMSFQNNDLSGTVPQGVCDLRAEDRIVFLEVDCSVGGSVECSCGCICF